ncbi:MAG: hypothetical protein Tsb0032_16960 [Kiloniellaceae bacterium]
MTGRLDRDELISLLETLGSENDEEALAAARVLDTKVKAAETDWSALLQPAIGSDSEAAGGYDLGDLGNLDELPADASARNAESLALIDKLLGKADNSEEFRQELEDYKADIAAGEFTDSDHRYIRALCKRLSA